MGFDFTGEEGSLIVDILLLVRPVNPSPLGYAALV